MFSKHAPFQPRYALGEDEEVGVGGGAGGGRVEVGVLVDDVLADGHVDRHRHAQANAGRQHARLTIGELLLLDHPPESFAQADAAPRGGDGGLVDSARLLPQTELAAGDVPGHALAGPADHGQLEVVDRPGAVEGQVREQSPLHEVDQERSVAFAEHVGSAGEDHRPPVGRRRDDPLGQPRQRGVGKGLPRTVGLDEATAVDVMRPARPADGASVGGGQTGEKALPDSKGRVRETYPT